MRNAHLFEVQCLTDLSPNNKANDPIDQDIDRIDNYYKDSCRPLYSVGSKLSLLPYKQDAGKRDQKIEQAVKESARPYIARLPVLISALKAISSNNPTKSISNNVRKKFAIQLGCIGT